MAKPGDKVWLLEVRTDGGYPIFRTVHSSREAAITFLARWCRGQWEEQGHGQERDLDEAAEAKLHGGDDAAVAQYFEYWYPDESFDVNPETVDPEPGEVLP